MRIRDKMAQLANFSKNLSTKKGKFAPSIVTWQSFTTILSSSYLLGMFF